MCIAETFSSRTLLLISFDFDIILGNPDKSILPLEKRSIFQTNSSRDRSTIQLSIGFRLSTSDPLGSTIESSKPNPILIDVNERRGETIARIISGATNTIHERPRDPYRGLILYSTEGCSDGGETTVREASSSSSSSKE
ncbi:hypothetical protein HZH68_010374 [Vespula germanica]|uniref:Uncharacterized protein n=1 Tax=Vespula germanica TaxID=30212 RepID=A0A834N1U1_VESGE|nr:hypothetical protein HZH68_010374 [Vespula germanica]